MAYAVRTANTSLNATISNLFNNPNGTHSFRVAPDSAEELYVIDNDGNFDDIGPNDTNQIVAPMSTIFTDNAAVGSRYKFDVTPNNGDPSFTVYLVFENATASNTSAPINTLNYALVSPTPLMPDVSYSISAANSDGTVAYSSFSNLLVCFRVGTRIETGRGWKRIEVLRPGDMVLTADHGLRPVRWVSRTRQTWRDDAEAPHKPVRFAAGALGAGLPRRDLVVTAQHRMLLCADGSGGEVLCPALGMTGLNGVRQMQGLRSIEVIHLMFDRHEIVFAEGVPTESFFPGRGALGAVSPAQRAEVGRILRRNNLPANGTGYAPARPFLKVQDGLQRCVAGQGCWTEPALLELRQRHSRKSAA